MVSLVWEGEGGEVGPAVIQYYRQDRYALTDKVQITDSAD